MLLLVALILWPVSQQARADNRFMPVSAIRPEMRGTGYTVVSGSKIEPFSVRVIGLLKGSGAVKNFILVKVSGKIFANGGGIAAGMSGSPVFIDNKLIGAIGYGFQNADPTYGLVTPIEDMLRIWSYPAHTPEPEEPAVFYQGGLNSYEGVAFLPGETADAGQRRDDKWLQARPVATPLLVSGLGERAFNKLYPTLASGNLLPVYTGLAAAGSGGNYDFQPKPGSAVSVTLVDGDYEVKSIGTLTWIENNQILAFGHPFFNRGPVDYGFGGAEILDTLTSNVFPFKMGVGHSPVGRITEDRGAGIAGVLGSTPEFIKVSVIVRGGRKTKRDHYSFRVIQDEQFAPGLILAGVMDAVDRRLDRIGAGTAKVRFVIEGENISAIKRENIYFGSDIAVASIYELTRLLQLLSSNEFKPVKLTSVSVAMEISPQRLSAKLLKTDLPKKEFMPGEEFIIYQRLLPYRGQEVKTPIRITLPEEMAPGKWILSVHGAGYDTSLKEDNGEKEAKMAYQEESASLEDLIFEFLSTPANNQLVVEAFPLDQSTEPSEDQEETTDDHNSEMLMEEFFQFDEDGERPNSHVWTESTGYFLTGEDQVVITIIDPDTEEDLPLAEGVSGSGEADPLTKDHEPSAAQEGAARTE